MLRRSLVCMLIVSLAAPVSAQQEITTPPIFVRPASKTTQHLGSEMLVSPIFVQPGDILDKQRQNQSAEKSIKQLIQETTQLTEAVQEKEKRIPNDIELFADYPQFSKLRAVLNSYLEQIEDRDRLLAGQEARIIDLHSQLEQNKKDQEQDRESLTAQYKILEEKSRQLNDFKEELSRTKESLTRTNDRYDAVIKEYETKLSVARDQRESIELARQLQEKTREAAELSRSLNAQNPKLEELKDELKRKDDQLAELAGSVAAKDKEIAAFKQRIEDMVKASREEITELNNLLQQKDKDLARGNTWKEQSEAKDKEIAELKQELDKGQQEAEHLRAELAKDDDAFAQIREKGLAMKNKLKEAQAHRAKAAGLQQQLDSKNGQFNVLAERSKLLEELAARRRQRIALLEEKDRLLTSQIGYYQQQQRSIQDVQAKVERLNKEITYKKTEQENTRRLLDRFTNRLKETSGTTEEQARTIASYQAKIDQLDEDLRKAKDEVQDKETAIDEMNRSLEQAKQTVKEAQQDAQAKELSLGMVQSMMGEKAKVHEALVAQLKNQVAVTGDELAQVREKLTVAEAKLKQSEKVETQNFASLQAVQDMLKASREETIQLNYLLQKKDNQIKDLQKGLDVNSKEFVRQNKTLEDLKADLDKQQAVRTKLAEDMQWKAKEVERLKMQLKQQPKRQSIVPAPVPMVKSEKAQVEALTAQLKETQEKLKAFPKDKRDHAQLRQALRDAKEQIATLKDKLRLKQKEIMKNSSVFMRMDKDNVELQKKYDDAFKQLKATQDTLKKCQDGLNRGPSN